MRYFFINQRICVSCALVWVISWRIFVCQLFCRLNNQPTVCEHVICLLSNDFSVVAFHRLRLNSDTYSNERKCHSFLINIEFLSYYFSYFHFILSFSRTLLNKCMKYLKFVQTTSINHIVIKWIRFMCRLIAPLSPAILGTRYYASSDRCDKHNYMRHETYSAYYWQIVPMPNLTFAA